MRSRPFALSDTESLARRLAEWNGGANPYYIHVGDFLWGAFQNDVVDPTRRIRVWEKEDGEIAAFVFTYGPAYVVPQPAPAHRRDAALWDAMLSWSDETFRAHLAQTGAGRGELHVNVLESDAWTHEYLAARGYRFDPERDRANVYQLRELTAPVTMPALPPGFALRAMTDEADLEPRVALHREVWHPSRVTLSGYRRMRSLPGYDPTLDIVLVAPDGRFAAYAILWWDPVNQVGEFEPVGTAPAFRRQGLGRLLMEAGVHLLSTRGAAAAMVLAEAGNAVSRALYAACGFTVRDTYCWRRRTVDLSGSVRVDRVSAVA